MGRRRKRLIVQADLTSEEDQAFLAWVLERRRKRRLAEEIRQGLQLQYRSRHPHRTEQPHELPEQPHEMPTPIPEVVVSETRDSGSAKSKLARLVGGF